MLKLEPTECADSAGPSGGARPNSSPQTLYLDLWSLILFLNERSDFSGPCNSVNYLGHSKNLSWWRWWWWWWTAGKRPGYEKERKQWRIRGKGMPPRWRPGNWYLINLWQIRFHNSVNIMHYRSWLFFKRFYFQTGLRLPPLWFLCGACRLQQQVL